MNKHCIYYSSLLLTAVLSASCVKEIEDTSGDGAAIELSSVNTDPMTKAVITGTSFTTDEAAAGIGLFLLDGTGASYGSNPANVKYYHSGSKWVADSPLRIGNTEGTLVGYYPYSETATNVKAIPVASSINGTDYLFGSIEEITSAKAKTESLTLSHALTRLKIIFKRDSTFVGDCSLSSLTIEGDGVASEGTLDATTGIISTTKAAFTVSELNDTITTTGITEDCLVVPAATSDNPQAIMLKFTVDGKEYKVDLTEGLAVKLQSGIQTDITLTVKNTSVTVNDSSINPWGYGGSQTLTVGGDHIVTIAYSSDTGIEDDVWIRNVEVVDNSVVVTARSISGQHLKCTMDDGEFCSCQSLISFKDPIDNTVSRFEYTFTISDIRSNITATIGFSKAVSITTSVYPENSGAVRIVGELYEGETVRIVPEAAYSYGISNWKNQNGDVLSDGYDYTVRLSQDMQITACFEENLVLSGEFSVKNDQGKVRKVRFTRGNLYCIREDLDDIYNCNIEQHQYDFNSDNYTAAHISHFLWCNIIKNATSYSYDVSWNGQTPFFTNDGSFTVSGFSEAGSCFALSNDEWKYLINTREASTVNSTSNARYFKGCIQMEDGTSMNGMFIFPDVFTWPSSVATKPTGINDKSAGFKNTYTYNDFKRLQDAGIVFLPAAGFRDSSAGYKFDTIVNDVGTCGYYWSSSTHFSLGNPYFLNFGSGVVNSAGNRFFAYAVRLVTGDRGEPETYNLSSHGTANSYIVSSANQGYSFDGLTKGCGNTLNGASIVGMDDCTLPSDSYVDLLYCEPEGLLELKSHKLTDGSILFYVPGYDEEDNPHPGAPDHRLKTKGNAIIAVRSNEGGEILWSWHIWVTDSPLAISNNGYSFMDRNLGALVGPNTETGISVAKADLKSTSEDIKYFGFYYQWGRKDPMIPGVTKPVTTTATVAEAVRNPDKFYGYTYPVQGYEWHTEESGVDKTALWGYRARTEFVKTVYDPCPPGYRVPELRAWTQATGTTFKSLQIPGEYDKFYFDGIFTWYPASGWIDADDQSQAGTISISHRTVESGWPAEKVGTDNFVYSANVTNFTDGNSVKHYGVGRALNASDVSGDGRPNSADACPVRCISTESKPIFCDLSKEQTSNCYIIPEAGIYMFKADVKGNGTAKVTTPNGTFNVYDSSVNIDHGQINHVAVLWWQGDLSGQTGNSSNSAGTKCPIKFFGAEGDVLPASPARNDTDFTDKDLAVVDANGYVRFEIDEDRYCHGNAILAAFDKYNNVLWSWHLWLTDVPQKVKLGPRTVDDHTYTYYCMDRNLGATYCPAKTEITGKNFGSDGAAKRLGTIGFYYQWGRKDPIQGPPGYNTGTGTYSSTWYLRDVNKGYKWTTMTTIRTHESVATRDEHVLYPGCFLYSTATTGRKLWNDETWGTSGDKYGQYAASWGSPAYTTDEPQMTKTINDPCPPGYYMPPHYFFAAANLANSGNDGNGISHTYNSEDTNGLFVTNGLNGIVLGAPMWFPFGGYRASGSGNLTNVGTNGAYHSGLDCGDENVRVFRLEHTGGGQYHLPPATGATVRCCAY